MTNTNPFERKRRKPGIQALPEERKRGVTIRFLPEMKDDIYDLRDWIEREGNKGKRLLTQILKYQGKTDELIERIKPQKKEEDFKLPAISHSQLSKDSEIQALRQQVKELEKMQQFTQQEREELEECRQTIKQIKQSFSAQYCISQNGAYSGFDCQQFQIIKRLLFS